MQTQACSAGVKRFAAIVRMFASGWQASSEAEIPLPSGRGLGWKVNRSASRWRPYSAAGLKRFCAVSGMFSLLSDVFCVD